MADEKIEIIITPDGAAHIEASGFAGKGCAEATKPIEEALGAVTKRTVKPEMYQPTVGVGAKQGIKK